MISILWIVLILSLTFLPLLTFYFVDKRRLKNKLAIDFYKINIGKSSVSISRNALYQIILWICILSFMDWMLSIPFFSIVMSVFVISSVVKISSDSNKPKVTSNTQDILESLREMQAKLSTTQSHIEEIAVEIENRKIEVDEKRKLTQSLDQDINKKLIESEEWKKLNDQQKQLVINAAAEAINNKSLSQSISIVIGSIFLNLTATLIWTLFGNPGKEQLLNLLKKLYEFIIQK